MTGYKDLGPNVSQNPTEIVPGGGQHSAEDHSFESLVFQQGKIPLDWELNLAQDIQGDQGNRRNLQSLRTSGFPFTNFLKGSGGSDFVFLAPDPPGATTANAFLLRSVDVVVNGWNIHLNYSDTTTNGFNRINLLTPPFNTSKVELVFLEVWRALVSPSDPENKSASGQILRYGNAKAPDGVGNKNLADDILDANFPQETSRRVQIQYRIRTTTLQNFFVNPDGLVDNFMGANTVPYLNGSTVDGNSTIYDYLPSDKDPGLWIAGDGDVTSVTDIGSVDGYMYAIPICAVYRRNSTAFSRINNLNGGGEMSTGISGRPDGLYCDQIVEGDIVDLRKTSVYDLQEILTKTYNHLVDNSLVTWFEKTASDTGGNTFLQRDNIGLSQHLGNPDSVRAYFSDRSVTETVVIDKIMAGTSLATIDLSSMPIAKVGTVNVQSFAPVGTNIVGVRRVRVQTTGPVECDGLDLNSFRYVKSINITAFTTSYPDRIEVVMNGNVTGNLLIEVLVEYPSGKGASRNVVSPLQFWTPPAANIAAWVDTGQLAATSEANRKALNTDFWWMINPHRELQARLKTTSQTFVAYYDGLNNPAGVYVPEMLDSEVSLAYLNGITPENYSTGQFEANRGYTKILLDPSKIPAANTAVTVTYKARRALPPVSGAPGDSYQLFYNTRAVQSVASPSGNHTLKLIPRYFPEMLSILSSGSGSPSAGVIWNSPGVQIPTPTLPAANYPESDFDPIPYIALSGLEIQSGLHKVPVIIPYAPEPSEATLFVGALATKADGEGRNFWPTSDDGADIRYAPLLSASPLETARKHKVVFPTIMELSEDFDTIGRKGTLVMVVFVRYVDFGFENKIEMGPDPSDSCAAIYRIIGNPVNHQR